MGGRKWEMKRWRRDEKVRERERERESEKKGKMTWMSVGEEIMTWRYLEEKKKFSQLRVLIYTII